MANITYRVNSDPAIPGTSIVKGAPLTNVEVDANFRAIDIEVDQLNSSTVRLTGDQTIGGVKTFSSQIVAGAGRYSTGSTSVAMYEMRLVGHHASAWRLQSNGTAELVVTDGQGVVGSTLLSVTTAGHLTATGNITAGGQFIGNVTGNAGTVTNGVYTTGDQTIGGIKTFSSAPVVPGINGGQLAGMRNKIINGKMEIAQRGTSFAAIANGAYSLDRWRVDYSTASVATISQQADVPSSNEFQSSLRFAVTTADASIAAGDFALIEQRVEGFNARDLVGRACTLSFWVRSSRTGVHCVAFRNAAANNSGDRSFIAEYTINAVNTWEFKTVTIGGGLITEGANWNWTTGRSLQVAWVLAAGSTYQTTAGAWQTGNFIATANQVNVLDTIDNIFAITGVQLEVGSVATPFEHRPIGAELALCQRYYQTLRGPLASTAATANIVRIYLPVAMRAAPTLVVTPEGGTGASYEAVTNLVLGQSSVHSIDSNANVLASAEL